MRYRYVRSRDFVDLGTPTVETVATNAAFPVTRLADWRHPSRPWRSTGLVSSIPTLRILRWPRQSPAYADMQMVLLLQTNIGRAQVSVTSNRLPRLSRVLPATTDPRDGRARLLIDAAATNSRVSQHGVERFELRSARGYVTGTFIEIGAVIGLPAWTELGANPQAPTRVRLERPTVRAGMPAAPETVAAGPAYLTDEWTVVTDQAAELTRWRGFARLGPDEAVLWDYRDGGLYLMRPTRIEIEEGRFIHTIRASWRQVV